MNIRIFRALPILVAAITVVGCESGGQNLDGASSPSSEKPLILKSATPIKSRFKEGDFFINKVSDDEPTILTDTIDTRTLQRAIEAASIENNGGVVRLEAGTYKLGKIDLKSNVRLEVDPGAVLIPTDKVLFAIGRGYAGSDRKGKKVPQTQADVNIEVTTPPGAKGRYTIDISADQFLHAKMRPFTMAWVNNFSISNFHVKDNYSKYSAIALGHLWDKNLPRDKNPTFSRIAENGVIKNASIEKAAYGYGLIQTQGLKNVLFQNLKGQGGVTLRLETGFDRSNQASRTIGGIDGVYAENISSTNGSAALLLSPHGKENGSVEVHNVTSYGSEFAVRIGGGFVNRKLKNVPGLRPGFFNSVIITNVEAHKDGNKRTAQLKAKHYKFLPASIASNLAFEDMEPTGDDESKRSEPVAPVLYLSARSFENPGPREEGLYRVNIDPKDVYMDEDFAKDVQKFVFSRR